MIIKFLTDNKEGNGIGNDMVKTGIDTLTTRESVALMGVHTLGRPHPVNSLFSGYEWTKKQSTFLNNEYFRNLAGKKTYIPFGGSGMWTLMGTSYAKGEMANKLFLCT